MAARGQKAQNAHQPTDASKRQIASMAASGVPLDKIARVMGINYRTLVKHYSADISEAKAKAEALVAQNLFSKASKGQGSEAVKAALIWLNKNNIEEQDKPKRIGRPSGYTEQKAIAVCQIIASGKPYTPEIARRLGLPTFSTIFRWLQEKEDFRQLYAQARELQADAYAEQIVDIADTDPDSQRARNRIDARKWHASHTNPKRWGDRASLDITNKLEIGSTAAEVLMRLTEQAKQAKLQAPDIIDITPTKD